MTSRFLLPTLAMVALGSAAVIAQPARIADLNPAGSDGVQARSLSFAYEPDNVDLFTRHWNRFVTLNGEAHFFATDGASGVELWRTDGSAGGTVRAVDFAPGANGSFPSTPVSYQGALYLTASPAGTNADRQLYRYDGFEVDRVSDRDLRPVGEGAGGLFLVDSDGDGYILGTCDPDGSGGVACAFEPFVDETGRQLPAPLVVRLDEAGYFSTGGVMYRSLLTGPTTRELFRGRRTATTSSTTNVIGGVGRPYSVNGSLLFDCFFAREETTDVQGAELCRSLGGVDDVALVQDFNVGPDSPGFAFVGVYGGQLYAIGRDPADRSSFRFYKTDGDAWSDASASALEFYRTSSPNDVFMLEAGTSTGYFAERARSSDPFPQTEFALFRPDGSRVTADGQGWDRIRTAGARGRGFFAGRRPGGTVALYQWDGGSGVTDLGPLPAMPISLKTYGGGVLMDVGSELWAYGVGQPSRRRAVSGVGTATFALSLGDEALPFTLDVAALGSKGEVQAAVLQIQDDSLAISAPSEAAVLLYTYYRAAASGGLDGLEGTVTVSYSDDDFAASGLSSEADLEVWKTDGAGGWILLPIVARDAAANTITAGPFAGLSDFVIGSTQSVATDDRRPDSAVLSPVFPNPASGSAAVTITLAEPAELEVAVFDALGRRVTTVHDGPLGAGPHRLDVDVSRLPAGVYVVRATVGVRTTSQRLVVVR